MIVCIAEKPSVAREIAKVLGANASHDGYMEGNGYQVTWTFGHLCTLKEPQDYTDQWRRWSLGSLPMIPPRFGIKLIDNQGYEKQFHTIERLMQAADGIVNCGDAGQEGELIQRWVMQKAKATCPVQRLWVSSLTEEAIREAFANLKPQEEYQSLYEAGLCRAIGDWLLGMNATRLYTLRFSQQKGQVLSIGRVQTPTLAMIVKRHFEIKDFKPEKYWVLSTVYRNVVFSSTKGKIKKPEEGEAALAAIRNRDFTVTDIQQKNGTEAPPRLFDLTSLQVECNKKFSFSADDTLKHIQSLYEKKLTTYPRTDARVLSSAVAKEITKNLNGLFRLPMYRGYIREIAEMGTAQRIGKTRYTDDKAITDHYAIIPTGEGLSALNSCSRTVANVYELIVRRFLSIFYPPAVFDKISMQVRIRTELFSASVKTCTDEGYQKVLDYSFFRKKESGGPDGGEQSSRAEDAGTLKDDKNRPSSDPSGDGGEEEESVDVSLSKVFEGLKKGAVLRTEKYLIRPGETKPPARYNSGSMILAMENAGQLIEDEELREQIRGNGIGTSATRAEILKKLETNRYIYLAKKTQIIQPTQLGEMIFDTVSCSLKPLLEPKLTASWEKGLAGVAEGSVSEDEYMTKLKDFVIRRTDHVKETDYRRELEQQFRYISRFYPEKSRASSWNQNFRSSGRTHTRARKEKNGN